MDGDFFSRISRIGREAAEAALRALDGEAWDPFCAQKLLDQIISAADGVRSLPAVLAAVRGLLELPLLVRANRHAVLQQIEALAHGEGCGVLDLMLANVTRRCLAFGEHDERAILLKFTEHVLDRAVIFPYGGPVNFGNELELQGVRSWLAPVAIEAAEELIRRPDAQRLGLARKHNRITKETNLLVIGGVP